MNTPSTREARKYRISFILNTVGGGLMLLLSTVSYTIEMFFNSQTGAGGEPLTSSLRTHFLETKPMPSGSLIQTQI